MRHARRARRQSQNHSATRQNTSPPQVHLQIVSPRKFVQRDRNRQVGKNTFARLAQTQPGQLLGFASHQSSCTKNCVRVTLESAAHLQAQHAIRVASHTRPGKNPCSSLLIVQPTFQLAPQRAHSHSKLQGTRTRTSHYFARRFKFHFGISFKNDLKFFRPNKQKARLWSGPPRGESSKGHCAVGQRTLSSSAV